MTKAMVLGLLKTYGPMSGYEIQQMMQSSKTDTWAYVNPASIYHALKKLREEGKVMLETVEKTGLRTKSIFNITEEGKYELRQLLLNSMSDSSVVFPAALYTALTFMDHLEPNDMITALEKQRHEIEQLYASMKAGYKEKEAALDELPDNVKLIFGNMFAQCELQLKCIEDILELIEEREI